MEGGLKARVVGSASLPIMAAVAVLGWSGLAQAQTEGWIGIGGGWGTDLGTHRAEGGTATARLVITSVPQQQTPIPWDYVVIDARFACATARVTYTSKTFTTVNPGGQRRIDHPEPEVAVTSGTPVERAFQLACGRTTAASYLTRRPSVRAFYDDELARTRR